MNGEQKNQWLQFAISTIVAIFGTVGLALASSVASNLSAMKADIRASVVQDSQRSAVDARQDAEINNLQTRYLEIRDALNELLKYERERREDRARQR